jgi:hypothetical protein
MKRLTSFLKCSLLMEEIEEELTFHGYEKDVKDANKN